LKRTEPIILKSEKEKEKESSGIYYNHENL